MDKIKKLKQEIKRLKQELAKYRDLSYHDELTGAFNRRKFNIDIETAIYNLKRYKNRFCIIMFDIDNLKQINDTEGHSKGDEILINTVKIINKNLRETDKLYRVGGDEFIILLNNTKYQTARKVAKRLQSLLKNNNINISYGVAKGDMKDIMLEKADKRLYKDKKK